MSSVPEDCPLGIHTIGVVNTPFSYTSNVMYTSVVALVTVVPVGSNKVTVAVLYLSNEHPPPVCNPLRVNLAQLVIATGAGVTGAAVGAAVGEAVGSAVGLGVGAAVGAAVGLGLIGAGVTGAGVTGAG
jgi:hypothetical protein